MIVGKKPFIYTNIITFLLNSSPFFLVVYYVLDIPTSIFYWYLKLNIFIIYSPVWFIESPKPKKWALLSVLSHIPYFLNIFEFIFFPVSTAGLLIQAHNNSYLEYCHDFLQFSLFLVSFPFKLSVILSSKWSDTKTWLFSFPFSKIFNSFQPFKGKI